MEKIKDLKKLVLKERNPCYFHINQLHKFHKSVSKIKFQSKSKCKHRIYFGKEY